MTDRAIDLRSDTVTKPTAAMRAAMAEAPVGDDVMGDDPTVIALEERVAALLDKEAAVFVPSGTMANQLAVRCHTQPGDEMLIDRMAHMYWYEAGAAAALSGVTCRHLDGVRGVFAADDVAAALRPDNVHFPPTRLLAVENTHNRGGGTVWPLGTIEAVCAAAHDAGVATHLDGARLWNAAVASGTPEATYAHHFDSVSVCFSKGLGAPVGSALVGMRALVERARRFRKQFGGGMRQAGIIAAGALYALEHHRERLADDHENARRLASGLARLDGLVVDTATVISNMVYIDVSDHTAATVADALAKRGVLVLPTGPHILRAVTSLAVDGDDIEHAIAAAAEALQTLPSETIFE